MRRRTIGLVLVSVLGVAALAWLGFGLFQAGYVEGAASEGAEIIIGRGAYLPGLYGFGVIGIMFKALFALLFFGLIARLFFFRPWAHTGHGHGRGVARHEGFRSRMDEHLTEWHRQAHEDQPADDTPEQA